MMQRLPLIATCKIPSGHLNIFSPIILKKSFHTLGYVEWYDQMALDGGVQQVFLIMGLTAFLYFIISLVIHSIIFHGISLQPFLPFTQLSYSIGLQSMRTWLFMVNMYCFFVVVALFDITYIIIRKIFFFFFL